MGFARWWHRPAIARSRGDGAYGDGVTAPYEQRRFVHFGATERALTLVRTGRATPVIDTVLIVAVFGVGLAGHVAARTHAHVEAAPLSVAMVVLAAAAAALLWWRRTHPFLVLGALLVFVLVGQAIQKPGLFSAQLGLEIVLLCFAIGAWSPRTRLALVLASALLTLTIGGSMSDGNGLFAAAAFGLVLIVLPLVAGYAARARRRYLEEVERRLVEAERDRDERSRRAIDEERSRLARELHDVVAHHVSLIGVQAGAARSALGHSPGAIRDALVAIESSSRDAVLEMRQLLDVLRPGNLTVDRAPTPGLEAVNALVERWCEAGYDVSCQIRGSIEALPAALSLSCYRLIEESLTNVARHSDARSARIGVGIESAVVTVTVSDPGPSHPASDGCGSGRGLLGMAERVALFGGVLTTGPTTTGGFSVTALLPLRAAS